MSKDCFLEAFGCFPTQLWQYSNNIRFLRQTEFPTNEKALNFFAKTHSLFCKNPSTFLAEALRTVPSFFRLEETPFFLACEKKNALKEKKDQRVVCIKHKGAKPHPNPTKLNQASNVRNVVARPRLSQSRSLLSLCSWWQKSPWKLRNVLNAGIFEKKKHGNLGNLVLEWYAKAVVDGFVMFCAR